MACVEGPESPHWPGSLRTHSIRLLLLRRCGQSSIRWRAACCAIRRLLLQGCCRLGLGGLHWADCRGLDSLSLHRAQGCGLNSLSQRSLRDRRARSL